MMKNYSKPTIMINDELSEGVYAASGCYTVNTIVRQDQQEGRTDYRIQVNGRHEADHSNHKQTLTISFNIPVEYKSSNGTLVGLSTGTTLVIDYDYTQNPTDNIGLGDLIVSADQGLEITSVKLTD